jgi:choline dehydrogenase-like flavoprotein
MAAAYRPAQGAGTATCRPDGVVVYQLGRDHGRGLDGGRLSEYTRREVLKQSAALAGGLAPVIAPARVSVTAQSGRTIRFGVIGLNHGHIYAQTEALRRGGGQLVSVYAGEPELVQAFCKAVSGGASGPKPPGDPGRLEKAGAKQVRQDTRISTPGNTNHEMGTARMGRDRRTSVLNGWNQGWDAPNLFVTDGACMTSSGNQNPSLTYMALTARACHYAVDEMKRGSL